MAVNKVWCKINNPNYLRVSIASRACRCTIEAIKNFNNRITGELFYHIILEGGTSIDNDNII